MKFKQKLKKVKQMFSDAWQCLVLKPRAFIINLIVPSQVSTKSETTGQRRTRTERQRDRLLAYLEKGNTVTCLNSYSELGITQLSYCISQLKHRGYTINTERRHFLNCHDELVKVVEYSLGSK